MNVLVCGGAGYIGSHTVRELVKAGHAVVVLDNLSRGHRKAVKNAILVEGDIADGSLVSDLVRSYGIDGCMHFAALSQVGESVRRPDAYYFNNLVKSINLLDTLVGTGVKYFIFSSTAAVYGNPKELPLGENHRTMPANPYGAAKLAFEEVLKWYSRAFGFKYINLRYFNAAGSDKNCDIGEDHTPETHLIPLVLQAASGKKTEISVFGTDYPTHDGTCIRDYIHVTDIALAHLLALDYLYSGKPSDCFNLGNGCGYSVLEVVKIAEEITGRPIPLKLVNRRPGDPAVLIASSEKAQKVLGWQPQHSNLKTILETAWDWHRKHPDGFGDNILDGYHVAISPKAFQVPGVPAAVQTQPK
ncbi:MAG TPA: UDP-glucose 4-epimerase GalE [Desulfotomaculum sp.]|nr:UDP-glucose 4-epimerase GalE [Desulfotomaculum sp.]